MVAGPGSSSAPPSSITEFTRVICFNWKKTNPNDNSCNKFMFQVSIIRSRCIMTCFFTNSNLREHWPLWLVLSSIAFPCSQVHFKTLAHMVLFTFCWCCSYISGPLAALVIEKIGTRSAVMLGGWLTMIGFTASSFATNLPTLYFTYGIITGKTDSFLCNDSFFSMIKTNLSSISGGGRCSRFWWLIDFLKFRNRVFHDNEHFDSINFQNFDVFFK